MIYLIASMMKNTDCLRSRNSSCGNGNSGLGLDLSGNTIQISSSLAGQSSATILVLLNNFQSLKSLQKSNSINPIQLMIVY